MKLHEKFLEKGLFQIMKENYPTDYQNLFDNMDAVTLDDMLIILCGERELAQPYLSSDTIVRVLLALYEANWQRYKQALNLNYSLEDTYKMKVTNNSNKTVEHTMSSTDTKNDKVYGFDSVTPSDSATQEGISNSSNNATENGTGETITTGYNIPMQDTIKKELILRKVNNYINIVLDDIKGYITLVVY